MIFGSSTVGLYEGKAGKTPCRFYGLVSNGNVRVI